MQKPPANLLQWPAEPKEMVTYFCRIYTFHAIDGTHHSVHDILEPDAEVKNIPWRHANGITTVVQLLMADFFLSIK